MTLTAKESAPAGQADPQTGGHGPDTQPPGPGALPPSDRSQILRLLAALVVITGIFLVAGLGDLLLFIVIIIVIVMLHELAHFATAKWSGMQVTEYFVGFGPRLWSFRKGETEYGVKAIPLGGYVRITGFTMLDEVAEEDEPRTYRQQAFWKRIIVASAGSTMHFIIAFVLALIIVFTWGVPSNNQTIMALDHFSGVSQTPAQAAGLKAGDTVVSFNGHPFHNATELQDDLARSAGRAVVLGVERDGHLRSVSVTPIGGRQVEVKGKAVIKPTATSSHGYIGIQDQQASQSVGFFTAIGNAASNVGSTTKGEVQGVGELFSASGLSSFAHQVVDSKAAAKAVAAAKSTKHPAPDLRPVSLVGIASLGVQAQQQGLYSLLELLVFVNVIFGMMNMLPMLPLDGGHVAIAAYEWIRTKKGQAFYRADITKLFPVVAVFLAFISVLVVSALYLDITHPL